jgi:hypothetical protein
MSIELEYGVVEVIVPPIADQSYEAQGKEVAFSREYVDVSFSQATLGHIIFTPSISWTFMSSHIVSVQLQAFFTTRKA